MSPPEADEGGTATETQRTCAKQVTEVDITQLSAPTSQSDPIVYLVMLE